MDSSHKMEISLHILHPWCRTECSQMEPGWVNMEDEASQWTLVILMPHRFCDWSVQLTMLCCDMVLPDHFPSHCCWILHLRLVSVSQYPSLLIVMPVESQSTIKIPRKSEKFCGLCMSMLFPLYWLASFQVCNNVTKICTLWLTLWRNLCCLHRWIFDGLMPSFNTNHVVHLCPDNCLPFCDCCPCASTTSLGNDISCFSLARTTKTI